MYIQPDEDNIHLVLEETKLKTLFIPIHQPIPYTHPYKDTNRKGFSS